MADVDTLDDIQNSPATRPENFHPAFDWQHSEAIASLNIVMEKYVHKVTGAFHYHLASDNPENVFLVAFRTVPMDSTGVAHILEHTALCGSEKYPVRDPFFMMIRRSLNTFMNAFTSSDWTAFPFASKNRKDFKNLLNVYLDAAFFSRLDELDFAQEGHRLEFAEPDNPGSELQYKGVVFNEMKGAMSSTNSVLWHTMCKYLFPSTTYHFNSGGDPEHIPDLSYEELLHFYKTHYHPSNSVFMTFGDISAFEHHQHFEELALSKFAKLNLDIEVDDEKRYLAPVRIEESYASDNDDKDKSHVVIGWLLGRSNNLAELFRSQLLSSVLLDNSASPLQKALETSELGSSPSPLCGLEDSNREMSFMAGLEGCADTSTEAVEALVLNTLREIADNGVPQDQVEAALHQLELNQREISGDSYPYGLQLILTGLATAMHRGDPIKLLNIEAVLEELRNSVKDKQFIPGLIRQRLLGNQHRITLTLKPDCELDDRRVAAEKQTLAKIKAGLSADGVAQIIRQATALAERQRQEDDPGVLPKVGLADVPATISEPTCESETLPESGLPLSFFGQGTNGLSYQQIVLELPPLDPELLDILPLYTSCLTEFGIGNKSYEEVQVWQSGISGGMNCFSSIRSHVDNEQLVQAFLTFSSKSLAANHEQLTDLIYQTITDVRFDEDQRLAELIEQICTRKENSITGQGHSLAMSLASSRMSPTAQLSHCSGGLEGIRRIKSLRDRLASGEARTALLGQFRHLHELISSAPRQVLLVAEPELKKRLMGDIDQAWNTSDATVPNASLCLAPLREQLQQAWTTSTQVNFCAKAYPTVPSSHEDNAVLHVLAGFLRNGFLHRAIREQGGAYGGGAGQDANSASFRFFSYRDPRLQETLNDFDAAIQWLLTENHPDHQLEEAILGVVATMDKPSSPAGEAKQAFYNKLFGRSLEHRMEFRQRILSTTMEDLKSATERYFDPAQASIGVIGNRESVALFSNGAIEIINL